MDKLKEIIASSYYLLGFLESKHENLKRIIRKNKDFKETTESKVLTNIIDYLINVLKSE